MKNIHFHVPSTSVLQLQMSHKLNRKQSKNLRSTKFLAMSLKVPNLSASIWGSRLDGSRALQKWQIDRYGMYSFLTNWQNWDITLFSNSSLGLVVFLCLVVTKSKSRLVCFLVLVCNLQECRFWPNLVLVSGVGGSFTQMKPEALWYSYDSFFLGILFLCYANLTICEKKIYNVKFITSSQKFLCGKLLPFSLLVITCYFGFIVKLL